MHQPTQSKSIDNADSNNEEATKARYNVKPSRDIPISPNDMVILLMGPTGTGKSTFIATLTGNDDGVGHGLSSETAEVAVHPYQLPNGKTVVLVDIPAFDDSRRADADVLEVSAAWLAATYSKSVIPSGILFFQRISDPRASGTTIKNLTMLRKLCGQTALRNMAIVTTFWDLVDSTKGQENVQNFSKNPRFWKPFIDRGCHIQQYTRSRQSGIDIIKSFERKTRIPLQIQIEMVRRGMKPGETSAGVLIVGELKTQAKEHEQAILELMKARRRHQQASDPMLKATDAELEALKQELKKTKERVTSLRRNSWWKIVGEILRGLRIQINNNDVVKSIS